MILSNFYWEITIKRGKNFRCFKPRTWVCSSRQNKAGNEARLDPEVGRDYPGNQRSTGQIKFGPFWIGSSDFLIQWYFKVLPCFTYLNLTWLTFLWCSFVHSAAILKNALIWVSEVNLSSLFWNFLFSVFSVRIAITCLASRSLLRSAGHECS